MIFQRQPVNYYLSVALVVLAGFNAMSQSSTINRKQLLTANIGDHFVKKVDIREIILNPGQKAPYHKHPCPVVGFIVSGSVLFQIEGDSLRTLKAGEAFYEPANMPITHFDNASNTEPLNFVAYYLLNDEKELIEILEAKK